MPAITSRYTVNWNNATQWASMPELGATYSDPIQFWTVDNYRYTVTFRIGEGRTLGLLFAEVEQINPDFMSQTMHYCFGQFYTNSGAFKFSQFAMDHFIETETWSVCPGLEAIDWIDGAPYTLTGDELVSDI
jgi:hypothetical protein